MIYFMDISRAYFNAKVDEDDPAYVELPPEIDAPPGMCALLKRHMYGTRRAADGWQLQTARMFTLNDSIHRVAVVAKTVDDHTVMCVC